MKSSRLASFRPPFSALEARRRRTLLEQPPLKDSTVCAWRGGLDAPQRRLLRPSTCGHPFGARRSRGPPRRARAHRAAPGDGPGDGGAAAGRQGGAGSRRLARATCGIDMAVNKTKLAKIAIFSYK